MTEPARISVNQFMVPGLALDDLARWCSANDVAGVGVLRSTVTDLGVAAVAKALRAAAVLPTSVCVAFGLISPDPREERALFGDAVRALEQATALGVPLVVVTGGPRTGLTLSAARERVLDRLAELSACAHRIGGRILVEPLHPAMVEASVFTTLSDTGSAVRGLDVGLVLDVWHLWSDSRLVTDTRNRITGIEIVHLSDWLSRPFDPDERGVPGEGLIDLVELTRGIRAAGFRGWWEMEVLTSRHTGVDLLERSLAGTRAVLSTLPGGAEYLCG